MCSPIVRSFFCNWLTKQKKLCFLFLYLYFCLTRCRAEGKRISSRFQAPGVRYEARPHHFRS